MSRREIMIETNKIMAASLLFLIIGGLAGYQFGYRNGVADTDIPSWKEGYTSGNSMCRLLDDTLNRPREKPACKGDNPDNCS